MDELIDRIEQTVSELMQYDMEHFGPDAQEMVNNMIVLFPAIIEIYSDPRMSDVRGDAMHWPGQLDRIIKSLEKGDYFEVVDVLYNETHPNLIELRDMLKSKGIL